MSNFRKKSFWRVIFYRSRWSSPVNTETSLYYYWSGLIASIVLYNIIMLIARSTFVELQQTYRVWWLLVDYIGDGLNFFDMIIESKKIILADGLRVFDLQKLRMNYLRSSHFVTDVASLLPTDMLFFFFGTKPWVRLNRVLRDLRHCSFSEVFTSKDHNLSSLFITDFDYQFFSRRRMFEFSDRTEIRTNMPNTFRLLKLMGVLFFIFHWNACIFFQISEHYGLGVDQWVFGYDKIRDVYHQCSKDKNANRSSSFLSKTVLAGLFTIF
uniref:Ion transport domain-containing protein n=1 Tax=Romanomermis culicivorax TaxID=13658 RepID=A0A915J8V0_ROMCU